MLVTSKKGLELIKNFEGLKLKAYFCPAGKLTIGYGHLVKEGESKEITEDEANTLLKKDLAEYESGVRNLIKVPISQGQFDALVSFAFNLGINSLKTSTLLIHFNSKKFIEAAQEFPRWCFVGKDKSLGILRRRFAEATLFLS
jgi:lysozyme